MGSFLTGAMGAGNSFAAQGANITNQDLTKDVNNTMNQYNQTQRAQGSLADALNAQAMGLGPNPAQLELAGAMDKNIAQNAGMIASQKGLSPALAQRLAAQNAATVGQQAAGQGALMGAQQQISARGQLASLYGQQQQGALGMQGTLQNSIAAQNNANVGMTSNMNQINAGVASQNTATGNKIMGGLLGGAASSLFAKGGMVPQKYGYGGAVDMPESIRNGGLNPPMINTGYFGQGEKSGSGGDDLQKGFSDFGKAMAHYGSGNQPAPEQQQSGGFANFMKGLFQSNDGSDDATQQSYLDADGQLGVAGADNAEVMLPAAESGAADAAATAGAGAAMDGVAGLAMLAARGGLVPQHLADGGDVMGTVAKLIPIAMMALNKGGDPAGTVPGKAVVKGDSLKNDKVPAMLSPKEIVIPRSITMHQNAPEMAAEFVRRELAKNAQSKKNFADGGKVPGGLDPNAPVIEDNGPSFAIPTQVTPPVIPGDSNPELDAKKKIYNQFIEQMPNNFLTKAIGLPGSEPDEAFGPNGEEPKRFNSLFWQNAERKYNIDQKAAGANQQQSYDKAVAENQARVSAGLAPLPVPQPPMQAQQPGLNDIPDMNQVGAPSQQQQIPTFDANELGNYQKSIEMQKSGLYGAANVQDQLGKANAELAHKGAVDQQELANHYQAQQKQYMADYDSAMKDYQTGEINPNHYAESQSSAGKVKTAIGLILGGMSGGMLGTENPALAFLNKQIDRDIDAQKMDLGKKANLITANYHRLGNLKDATDMTRAMLVGIQAEQFKEAAAKAQGPMAKNIAMQEYGKLMQQVTPIMSQIALRQTMMKGMANGQVDPGTAVRAIIQDKTQQTEAFKEIAHAKAMMELKDNTISAIKHIHGSFMNGLMSPKDTQSAKMALAGRIVKETEGRFNQEAAMNIVDAFFPQTMEANQTTVNKRKRAAQLFDSMVQTPVLDSYGINVKTSGRSSLPEMGPPVPRK